MAERERAQARLRNRVVLGIACQVLLLGALTLLGATRRAPTFQIAAGAVTLGTLVTCTTLALHFRRGGAIVGHWRASVVVTDIVQRLRRLSVVVSPGETRLHDPADADPPPVQ